MPTPITFYFGSGSPYAWTVWLALEHKKLPYEARRVHFDSGELKSAAFLALNPRGQVPTLVDDGFAMYESAAMIEYLEDRYPDSGAPLWPRDVTARALARRRAAEALSHMGPVNNILFGALFGSGEPAESAIQIAKGKQMLAAELAVIESSLEKDFLAGDQLSAADFTLYPYLAFLGRADSRKPGHDLLAMVSPKTAAWMKRIEALPYFANTYPPHWKES